MDDGRLDEVIREIESIREQLEPRRAKDFWDKLSVASGLISSVILASVGGIFTYYYDQQKEQEHLLLQQHQNQIRELDAVSKFVPYLSGTEEEKEYALIAIKTLASTEIATELALLSPTEGAARAVVAIAGSDSLDVSSQRASHAALAALFARHAGSVVAVQSQHASVSGFSVGNQGHVVTVDYLLEISDAPINVTDALGVTRPARIVRRDPITQVMVLQVEGWERSGLQIARRPPEIGEKLVVIGYLQGVNVTPDVVTVTAISHTRINYSRSAASGLGTGGGPILNSAGEVVAMHFSLDKEGVGSGILQAALLESLP